MLCRCLHSPSLSLCLVAVCFALLCIPLLSHTLRFDLTQHNSVSIRYCILMAKAISVYACNWCVPSLLCRIAAAAGVDIYPCVSRHCFYMCSLSHSLSLFHILATDFHMSVVRMCVITCFTITKVFTEQRLRHLSVYKFR